MPSGRVSRIRSYVTNSDTHFHRSVNLNFQRPIVSNPVVSLPTFEIPSTLIPPLEELENADELIKTQMENIVKQVTQNYNSINTVNTLVQEVNGKSVTNTTDIASLKENVQLANQEINANKTGLTNINTNIANLEGKIVDNVNKITSVDNKVNTVNDRVTSVDGKFTAVDANITTVNNKVDNNVATTLTLQQSVTAQNAKFTAIDDKFNTVNTSISTLQENDKSHDSVILAISTQLTNVGETVSQNSNTLSVHNTQFDNINTTINGHTEQINAMKNDIDTLKSSTSTNTNDTNSSNTITTSSVSIADISAILQSIDDLTVKNTNNTTSIGVLDTSVNQLFTDIAANKANLSTIDEQVADLSKTATNNAVDVITIKDQFATIDAKTSSNTIEIQTVKTQLSGFDDKLNTNTSAISSAVSQINAVSQTANNNISEITELSKKIASGKTVFDNVKTLCSTVLATFVDLDGVEGGTFTGSGSFITLNDNDIVHGIFLTCAHMVMRAVGDKVQYAQNIYIENPSNKEWLLVTPNMVFSDGVGDIAIIKTNINFTNSVVKPLKIASNAATTGETCYVIGDPAGLDSDSIVQGIVRSGNYTMKPTSYQINECLFIDAPTISGNSGSPILNTSGEIVGMLTYGSEGYSTFGGGPNVNSLTQSLSVLSQFKHNKEKKYFGLKWGVVYPMTLFDLKTRLNAQLSTTIKGLSIKEIDPLSPFSGQIEAGDIILSAKSYDSANVQQAEYQFGVHDDEYTLGVLLYKYNIAKLEITVISSSTGQIVVKQIPFTKTYADVPAVKDMYLSTGLAKKLDI